MLGYLLQPLVNRRIEILLTAFDTYPGWHTIDVDSLAFDLAFEMKPSLNDTPFYLTAAEFAYIMSCFSHLSLLYISCDD
jgi:hypothetical protein